MLFASHHKALLRLIGAGDCNVAFATLPENINDEDELLQAATEREQNNLVHVICFYRMLTAFWFRQYDEAACYRSRRVIGLLDIFRVFVEGLTGKCKCVCLLLSSTKQLCSCDILFGAHSLATG